MDKMNIYDKLICLQNELKCNKSKYNSFGNYYYRSLEDILEAVKPLCEKYGLLLTIFDTMQLVGERYYIVAHAVLTDTCQNDSGSFDKIEVTGIARETFEKKGMDTSQITGATSSYARKYALNGLFCIDDTKDTDTEEYQNIGADKVEKIDTTKVKALKNSIKNKNIYEEEVKDILNKYNYTKIEDINILDYNFIVEDFKKILK